jgi:hypothetical protein
MLIRGFSSVSNDTLLIQYDGSIAKMSSTKSDNKNISEFLFDLETTLDLCMWEIDNIRIWDYVRVPLHRQLFETMGLDGETQPSNEDILTYFKGIYLWGRNIFLRNPLFGDCEILGFSTGRRKKMKDGYWWDIYFDPIYTQKEFDYLHIDQHFNNAHKKPAKTGNLMYNDFIHYSGTICRELGLFDPDFSHGDREMIAEIERHIKNHFNISMHITPLVERKIREAKTRKPLYDLLLERVDPEIALLICSYGRESFIKSCKNKGVPVAELQHGAIDPYHPGYSFQGESTKSIFPDYFFVWGEFWKENIEFPIPDENVIVTGYPYLEIQSDKYNSLDKRDQIVVISQANIGTEISRFAVQLAKDNRVSADIIYKLHPKEYDDWKDCYPWLLDADLTVVDSDNPPLYKLLAESQSLLGVYSTVIYEGLYFGLETFLLEAPGISTMEWVFDLENVSVVDSMDNFVESYQKETEQVDTTLFFADRPIEKLEHAIQRIVSNT